MLCADWVEYCAKLFFSFFFAQVTLIACMPIICGGIDGGGGGNVNTCMPIICGGVDGGGGGNGNTLAAARVVWPNSVRTRIRRTWCRL